MHLDRLCEHYLLRVTIRGIDNPRVTRILSVPMTTTLKKFHAALQIAFGWNNSHAHRFRMVLPAMDSGDSRETYSPSVLRLEGVLSERFTLKEVLANQEIVTAHCKMEYHYGFGYCWEHTVEMIGSKIDYWPITCVGGRGHDVAEDCGGFEGWECLKKVFRKVLDTDIREEVLRNMNQDEVDRVRWYQRNYRGGWLDPDLFSIIVVNSKLDSKVCEHSQLP